MKTSSTWNYGTIVGRMMMGLVLAIMVGSMDVASALAKDNHKGRGGHDRGRSDHRGNGHYHGRVYQPNPHVRGHHPAYRPYGFSYGYRERIYAPPPVIYAPLPPPGISIFFPPIIIHP